MSMSVGGVLALLGIMTFIILMKVMICSCFMRRQQCQPRRGEDSQPILEEDEVVSRLYEIHQTRMRARRTREPPPTFEDALRHSRPVSYIDLEEPPPTYDEYLNSNSKDNYLDYTPSVNPTDTIIAMEVVSITSSFSVESSA